MAEIKPVPSATVTLVRDIEGGYEVLLMKRNLQSVFVPGMHVFPGGAVDAADSEPAICQLSTGLDDAHASSTLQVASCGLAYWTAAIREAFEEAGLLMAYDERRELVALNSAQQIERFVRHRHALNQGACGMLDILRAERLTLAVDQLVYFSHWITPLSAPRRYDTRFFVAAAPSEQVPLHDNTETIGHVWVRPGDALDAHRKGDFKMRFPTVRTLEEFASYASVDSLMKAMRAKRNIPAILPRISSDGGRVLPGEPGYEVKAADREDGQWKV